jgi:hypothetical protein
MAENKKSFVLYTDSQGLVNQLPDDIAGRLFKHIYAYVNDENPISDELLLNIAFEPIKMQLKRDLIKWETQLEQRRQAGLKSAEIRKRNATSVNERSISSTDNVNVNVNVNDNVIKDNNTAMPFSFFNSLILLGAKKELINDWLKVRKTKKLTNTETAFKNLKIEFDKSGKPINQILEKCITESWGGFKSSWSWNNETTQKEKPKYIPLKF